MNNKVQLRALAERTQECSFKFTQHQDGHWTYEQRVPGMELGITEFPSVVQNAYVKDGRLASITIQAPRPAAEFEEPAVPSWELDADAEPLSCSDGFWYGLAYGGYVDVEKVLTSVEQVQAVYDAVALLVDLKETLQANDLWEEM